MNFTLSLVARKKSGPRRFDKLLAGKSADGLTVNFGRIRSSKAA